jgi:hypothetical protein
MDCDESSSISNTAMNRNEALQAAHRAVIEWRREAACNPAEQHRRHQLQLRLEALIAEVNGEPGSENAKSETRHAPWAP